MKRGITFWLLLATACLSTGCVWRSAYYDPETGIVHGGGFDCFHRRWFNNMRADLREHRCNSCSRRLGPGMGDCDSCGDVGDACGCGHDGHYLPRRSRHYGSSSCGCQNGHDWHGPYETYGDGDYIDGEYFDGEYVEGDYIEGEHVHGGEAVYDSPRHADDCPHCRRKANQSGPTPQAYIEPTQPREQHAEREGWREVSPDEYHNAPGIPRQPMATQSAPPTAPSEPPVSIDTGSMTPIRQRERNSRPPVSAPQLSPPSGSSSAPSSDEPLSTPQWNPPTPGPNRSFNDASSTKWVPSRL